MVGNGSLVDVRQAIGTGVTARLADVVRRQAPVIVSSGIEQFLVTTKSNDADPVVLSRHIIHFDTDEWVVTHPVDFLAQRREAVKARLATGQYVVGEVDRNDVRLVFAAQPNLTSLALASNRMHSSRVISWITITHTAC